MSVVRPASETALVEASIPRAWLIAPISTEAVREAQLETTEVTLTDDELRLVGAEIRLERNWLKQDTWPRIHEAVRHGFVQEVTPSSIRLHADRRVGGQRRSPVLLRRLRERGAL